MPEPTLLLMTVDTEEAWDWSAPFATSGQSVAHIARLPEFQARCERHGIRPTYFANHAVLADALSRATMVELAARSGVEVGMHIHPWNTPPFVPDDDVPSRETYLHNLGPDVVHAKLMSTWTAFREAGLRPRSFRGGRYSTGGVIHDFLRASGFVADLSIVPHTSWRDDGAPDFRRDGPMPRRIGPDAVYREPLWEIPQSAGFTRAPFALWSSLYRAIERSPLSRLHVIGVAERLGLVRRVWLNFEIDDDAQWVPFLKRLRRMSLPVVTLTVHSSSLFAGPGPYTPDAAAERRIGERIERVFDMLNRMGGFQPATAIEAARTLEARVGAPTRALADAPARASRVIEEVE